MADIMTESQKLNEFLHIHEDDGFITPWNRTVADGLARSMGVQLAEPHWELVQFLRHYFEEMGSVDYARDLSGMLEQRYHPQGGLRYLYTLLPGGPITQGCRIAGIPVPRDSSDPAFGYRL